MTATKDLRSEHIGVARMLAIMEAMAIRLDAGHPPDIAALDEAIEFLRVFVDRCHHGKEEELLFPALRAAGISSVEPTIVTLLDEHVQGRAIVSRIVAGTSSASEGSPTAAADLARAMREFGTLLHAHIRREENDCFAVADRELPAQVQEQLLEGYERIEREVIGAGRHEAFHAMLERLADTYVR